MLDKKSSPSCRQILSFLSDKESRLDSLYLSESYFIQMIPSKTDSSSFGLSSTFEIRESRRKYQGWLFWRDKKSSGKICSRSQGIYPSFQLKMSLSLKVDDTTAERSVGKMLMSVIFERFCVLCTSVGLTNLTPTQCLQIPQKFSFCHSFPFHCDDFVHCMTAQALICKQNQGALLWSQFATRVQKLLKSSLSCFARKNETFWVVFIQCVLLKSSLLVNTL